MMLDEQENRWNEAKELTWKDRRTHSSSYTCMKKKQDEWLKKNIAQQHYMTYANKKKREDQVCHSILLHVGRNLTASEQVHVIPFDCLLSILYERKSKKKKNELTMNPFSNLFPLFCLSHWLTHFCFLSSFSFHYFLFRFSFHLVQHIYTSVSFIKNSTFCSPYKWK